MQLEVVKSLHAFWSNQDLLFSEMVCLIMQAGPG
jgi:hypothetical protein